MILPPSYLDNPYYIYKAVQLIQQDFNTNITWLENRCFGIALRGVNNENKYYPQIYDPTTGDNADIRPDVDVDSYAFFEADFIKLGDDSENGIYDNVPLSVTFWGNLLKIDSTKKYDYTGELQQEVVNILEQSTGLREAAENIEIFINPEDVYAKYSDLQEVNTQFLMRPYTYFKINFTLKIKGGC